MKNPLLLDYSDAEDRELVQKAVDGDRQALDALIRRHQPFIFNVAWKMVLDPNDAWDLTQEVLIKVITKLGQFQQRSAFRTWLYRIVANEFLMSKRGKREQQISDFSELGRQLDAIPSLELNAEEAITLREVSEEMRMRCMSGMLLCLNREQRLIYILGDSFGIDHTIGAEIFNISNQNFRVKLHRARRELYNYMDNKCGLVNHDNPCRCPKKAKAMHQRGVLNEDSMLFNRGYRHKIADYVTANFEAVGELYQEQYTDFFRDHPTREDFGAEQVVDQLLRKDGVLKFFERE